MDCSENEKEAYRHAPTKTRHPRGSRLASMLIYLATGLCCIVTVYPMY